MIYTTEIELPCAVDYEFQPHEPMARDCPGCSASVTVNCVMVGGNDITGLLTAGQISDLEQEILEHKHNNGVDHIDARADYEYERMREARV